jgi:hypothetical protein
MRLVGNLVSLSNPSLIPFVLGRLLRTVLDSSSGYTESDPTSETFTFAWPISQGPKYGAADYLLLSSQIILKQLVSDNVAGDRVVH